MVQDVANMDQWLTRAAVTAHACLDIPCQKICLVIHTVSQQIKPARMNLGMVLNRTIPEAVSADMDTPGVKICTVIPPA